MYDRNESVLYLHILLKLFRHSQSVNYFETVRNVFMRHFLRTNFLVFFFFSSFAFSNIFFGFTNTVKSSNRVIGQHLRSVTDTLIASASILISHIEMMQLAWNLIAKRCIGCTWRCHASIANIILLKFLLSIWYASIQHIIFFKFSCGK